MNHYAMMKTLLYSFQSVMLSRLCWAGAANFFDHAFDFPQLAFHLALPFAVVGQAQVGGEKMFHFVTRGRQHFCIAFFFVGNHSQFLELHENYTAERKMMHKHKMLSLISEVQQIQ